MTFRLLPLVLAFVPALAAAQEAPPTDPVAPVVRKATGPAKANAGRFVVEFLGSGLAGGLAAYGTYSASCGGDPCLGGLVGGSVVNIGLTPLAAWGIGRALGGEGDLGYTYVGGMMPFTATGPIAGENPGAALGVGMALMPLTSALMFELTSHMKALGPVDAVGVEPSADGAVLTMSGRF